MFYGTQGEKSQQHVGGTHSIPRTRISPSRLLPENTLRGNYVGIIGRGPRMLEVLKQVDRIANTVTKVLICGETGTGKELIAHALHHNSDRSRNKMISINCSAIPEMLFESELFGHEKGHLPTRKHNISANLKEHTTVHFSSMKLEICPLRYKQNCYEQLRQKRLNASAEQRQFP